MRAHIGTGLKGPQRTLAVLPMFHVFALTCVLNFSIEIAAELVLLPRFGMKQMLAAIKRKPPTLFFGVPTLFIAMNALPEAQLPDLSRLRACISGGAPLPLDVRTHLRAADGGSRMRRLRPDRGIADRGLQPGRWADQGKQLRAAFPRHGDRNPRSRQSRR